MIASLDESEQINISDRFEEFREIYSNPSSIIDVINKLRILPFRNLMIETGPKCNYSCKDCYAKCSPSREGSLDSSIIEILSKSIGKTSIDHIIFSEGEPFLKITELVKSVNYLNGIAMSIITNADFAKDFCVAENYLNQIKDAGFIQKTNNSRSVFGEKILSYFVCSADDHHGIQSYNNALTLLDAYFKVFKDVNPEILQFKINHVFDKIEDTNPDSDSNFKHLLLTPLEKRGYSLVDVKTYNSMSTELNFEFFNSSITLSLIPKSLIDNTVFDKKKEERNNFNLKTPLTLRSNGDVIFNRINCQTKGNTYGNVNDSDFDLIQKSISNNPLYYYMRSLPISSLINFYDEVLDIKIDYFNKTKCAICKSMQTSEISQLLKAKPIESLLD